MPVYKCNECSHEYIQQSQPSNCEVCNANDFKIIEEKKNSRFRDVKKSIPSIIEETIIDERLIKPSPVWLPISKFAKFEDGSLFQQVSKPNWGEWSVWNTNSSSHNIQKADYSLDVKKVNGPNNCLYGILTTIQEPTVLNCYYLLITSNGHFSIGKHSTKKWKHHVDRKKHSSIRQGDNINTLRVVTEGDLITGFINGQKVESFRDKFYPYKSSNIGVYSTSNEEGNGVAVYFNNIKVITTIFKD
ncbi:MAG: hypothetical protein MGG11_08325 [Trichodesmium sp. MAG_R03]|nr:hypothetical protein [Trichodesmium sp. MAG_R03]